jgi:hypothetical protein
LVTTADLSFRAPAWLNPVEWVRSLWAAAARAVTGHTAPPSCADASLPWATLTKQTTMLHACMKANPDTNQEVRAEAFLKSNRGFYLKVSHTPGADYLWQQDAETLFGAAAARFLDGAGVRIVPPGAQLSVGYRRPPLDTQQTITPYLDLTTVALSTVAPLLGLFVTDDRAGFAGLYAVQACGHTFPAGTGDVEGWWGVFQCVFTDALPQLADERKALAAARSLLEGAPGIYSIEGAKILTDVAGKLQLLAKAIKVIGLVGVIRDEIAMTLDGLAEARAGRGSVDLLLSAGPLGADRLLNAEIPAGSCTDDDGRGWDDTVPVQLVEGQGQTQVPGTESWLSILEAQVLGWADFDSDGEREVAMMLRCSGSSIENCCSGQASLMWFVATYKVDAEGRLTRTGSPFNGGEVYPGTESGPAHTAITTATLDGTAIRTEEYVLYSHTYDRDQLGGLDPANAAVRRVWRQGPDGTWTSSSP